MSIPLNVGIVCPKDTFHAFPCTSLNVSVWVTADERERERLTVTDFNHVTSGFD